jgi:hypothetical protein
VVHACSGTQKGGVRRWGGGVGDASAATGHNGGFFKFKCVVKSTSKMPPPPLPSPAPLTHAHRWPATTHNASCFFMEKDLVCWREEGARPAVEEGRPPLLDDPTNDVAASEE